VFALVGVAVFVYYCRHKKQKAPMNQSTASVKDDSADVFDDNVDLE